MTKNLRYIFILLAMLMATQLFAQNPNYQGGVWYSLYDTEDHTRTSRGDFTAKTIFTPAESMTFQYRKLTGISINGNIEVKNYIINSGWSDSKETVRYSSTSWTTSSTIPLDSAISQVRCTMTSGNGGQVRNHFVKLRKHILLNNGTSYGTTSLSAGNQTNLATSIGVRSTNAYTIPLRSFYTTTGQITITSNNPEFHFSDGSASKTFTLPTTNFCASASYIGSNPGNNWQDISNFQEKIYFTPSVNIRGTRSATITITDGTYKATITISAPVIPTYYFHAEAIAVPAEGGTATANFDNQQNIYSLIAPNTSTEQMTAEVTFSATASTQDGYVFDGWKVNESDTEFFKKGAGTESFTETITSNALSPEEVQRTYYAIFSQRYHPVITGSNYYHLLIDREQAVDFRFVDTQTEYPSSSLEAPFYYTIDHQLDGASTADCPEQYRGIVIEYLPEAKKIIPRNAGTATITFYHKNTDTHDMITPYAVTITVIRHTPVFTWQGKAYNETTTEYFNTTYNDYFVSSSTTKNTSATLTYSTEDSEAAMLHAGSSAQKLNLTIFNKETNPPSSIYLTVTQAENYYWESHTETHTITPRNQNNHVTFTIDSNDKMNNVFKYSTNNADDLTWDSGIRLGDDDWVLGLGGGDGGYDWSDKYIIIEFTGIPDTLYLTTNTDDAATTGTESDLFFYISEGYMPQGASTPTFTQTWEYKNKNNDVALKLNPDTRFVKLCYTGNLRGWFKGTDKYSGVTITELNQFEARPDVLDFGQQYVDNPDAVKTFDFHYANAGYKVYLESTDPHFTLSTTYIDTIGGEKYGIVKDIQVTYHPNEEHNTSDTDAKILIWDEAGHHDTIFLTASTIKSTPTLYWTQAWSATEPIVLLDQTVTNAAASTNGYSTVKYRSSNENKIRIINGGTAFEGIDTGRVVITAYQEPDRAYNAPEEIFKTFIVTDKIAQYIVWEDNLTNLRTGDDPVTLTAEVWVMTDAATNTWEYSPEQTAKLQYHSPNDAVVSVASNSNILNINGVGELMLEAFILADSTYEYAHAQVPVRVRDHSSTCTDEDLIIPVKQNGNLLNLADKLEYDPYLRREEHVVEIDTTQGVPGELIFGYYGREAWWQLSGRIRVYESTDGGNSYRQILSDADAVTPLNQELQYSPRIPLSRNATHIKFQRFESVNMGYHILQYITILPAKYIEAEDVYWGNIYLGNTPDTTITFDYSSVRGDMEFSTSHTNLRVSPSTISKECGDWGSEQLTITLVAAINVIGDFHEKVYIYDKVGNISDTINVYATIIKNTPTITWETTLDTIRSSAEWETQKTAFASSGDQVHYELTEGDQMDEYAYLNDSGKMILLRGGIITARAYTVETNISNEVSEYRRFFILVDPLFEDTDNDHNWLNDNNWNIGRTPWDTDSATIQADKSVVLSSHITIHGLKFQSNSNIHILHSAGLSVGAQGITGAATDGSSLIIDNLKTGAGFLRISPKYTSAMPKVTIRYQTRSTLDTGANKDATWQYFGAPGANCQFTVDYITWLYQWSEPYNWQQKSGTLTLEPFAGYAITQYGKPTYELIAEPINKDQTIVLTKTPENLGGMDGDNLFANSFMAPIDIKNFTADDFTGDVNKTFYIFNSGSWNQWNGHNEKDSTLGNNGSTTPGQYCAIPALSAKYLDSDITTLPPMQGIYVIANENGATIKLNYNKHVFNAGNYTDSTNMNEPMRAPQRDAQEQMQRNDFLRMRLQVNSANSGADRMYIIQEHTTTRDYDNGYDAPNQFAEGIANIYTTEAFGKMEVSCANDIDSMYIGFQAGNDEQYTLSYRSLIGESLYLKDLSNDSIFLLTEGGQYHFTAQPLSTNDLRFQVLLNPMLDNEDSNAGVTTDMNDIANTRIWHNHNQLYITNAPTNSALALYNTNGQLILSYTTQQPTHTIDLNYLHKGVYILQLNNQMYKFVRQ